MMLYDSYLLSLSILYQISKVIQLYLIDYNIIQEIYRTMSQFNLFDENTNKIPYAPNLSHTLLLIETNRYVPIHSNISLDQNFNKKQEQQDNQSLSLQDNLRSGKQFTIPSTSMIKKKKIGCTCKKTKCLKMYCQCFSTDKMCSPQCSCHSCSNNHEHIESISKAKSIIKMKALTTYKQNQGKGCSCKRTQCIKKYCECYSSGTACGLDCKCEGCANGESKDLSRNNKEQKEELNFI